MKNALSNVCLVITEVRQKLNISQAAAYELSHSGAIPACYLGNSSSIYTNSVGG